jgi:hypothetical protein
MLPRAGRDAGIDVPADDAAACGAAAGFKYRSGSAENLALHPPQQK